MPNSARMLRNEVLGSKHVPYVRHVDASTIGLTDGGLLSVIEVAGMPHDTADMADVNAHHRALNGLLLNLADEQVMVWSVLVRRRAAIYPQGTFRENFVQQLDQRYGARMNGAQLFRNRLFVCLLRAPADETRRRAAALLGRRTRGAATQDVEDELKRHRDTVRGFATALSGIGARTLTLVEANGLVWSEPTTVLHWLCGGRQDRVPLTMGPLWSAAYQDRLVFGREVVEIRHTDRTEVAGVFGIKEYPSMTRPTMMDELLVAPMELTAVNSFRFVGKSDARDLLTRVKNQVVSARDAAAQQAPLLSRAADDLADNHFCIGEHHGSVTVFADDAKQLSEKMATARSMLVQGGAVMIREDIGLEAAWWAQLPGNNRYRTRRGLVTSRNMAAFSPLHGFPMGQPETNHWGPATAILTTASGAPYYFSWHVGDLGNTYIVGPSGSGKTVVLNFLLAQSLRHDPKIVVFDKDRGCDIFIRAVGGRYLTLQSGKATGCAPLKALEIEPARMAWFVRWIETMAGGTLSPQERAAVPAALDALRELPREARTIKGLRLYLDNSELDGLSARLARWQAGHELGWVFDNKSDDIALDAQVLGFDMTDVLDTAAVRGPLMDYLFERIRALVNGQRIIIAIDEFWKAIEDPGFRAFVNDYLKTIRKQNGLLVFATQSPRDALRSPIAHTIIEQCPTQILMPNNKADRGDYREGLKLTAREFALVSELLGPGSRRFLIKQNGAGVVAALDLNGFDEELVVLSGRTASIRRLDALLEETSETTQWLPRLIAERTAVGGQE
jgi:type IV secretion system protein VirB4